MDNNESLSEETHLYLLQTLRGGARPCNNVSHPCELPSLSLEIILEDSLPYLFHAFRSCNGAVEPRARVTAGFCFLLFFGAVWRSILRSKKVGDVNEPPDLRFPAPSMVVYLPKYTFAPWAITSYGENSYPLLCISAALFLGVVFLAAKTGQQSSLIWCRSSDLA